MKEFHFTKIYFSKLIFNDEKSKIRVVIKETPSLEVTEEDYSLRVETRHKEDKLIHRDYAIEHHISQPKHSYPHMQFKFHTEEIGTFRIRLDFESSDEYKRAILGFIYKIKDVLKDLEKYREGITNEIMVLDLVNKLSQEGEFLIQKISESLSKYQIEFDQYNRIKNKQLEKNYLLTDFLGKDNIRKILRSYNNRKFTRKYIPTS